MICAREILLPSGSCKSQLNTTSQSWISPTAIPASSRAVRQAAKSSTPMMAAEGFTVSAVASSCSQALSVIRHSAIPSIGVSSGSPSHAPYHVRASVRSDTLSTETKEVVWNSFFIVISWLDFLGLPEKRIMPSQTGRKNLLTNRQ